VTGVVVRQMSFSADRSLLLLAVDWRVDVRPGQFAMLKVGDWPVVPRPFSICAQDREAGTTSFLIWRKGLLWEQLLRLQPGATIQVKGPLGNGFPEVPAPLLVGGGCGVAPLLFVAATRPVAGFYAGLASAAERAFLAPLLPAGTVVTVNPQFVTDAFLAGRSGGPVFACGPSLMLRVLADRYRGGPVWVSLEERMACGEGLCKGCPVRRRDGSVALVCSDGPVFPEGEVSWTWQD
jgi:dihydroorotate dehydrogenase electron transfer subunit